MKKTLIALFSVMALLVATTAAFALHQSPDLEYTPSVVKAGKSAITLGGQIRFRGDMTKNLTDWDSDSADTTAAFNSRVRLNLKAVVSPSTMGFIELETGDDSTADTYTWGNCSSAATGGYKSGNCKPDDLFIRQAYISHQGKLGGMTSGIKVGHMLYVLGNGLFFDHSKFGDDGITAWMAPMDGTEISLNLLKLDENTTSFSDDATAYVLTAEHTMGGINLSGDITYLDDKSVNYGVHGQEHGLTFWNIGLRGGTDVSGIGIKADLEIQTGTAKDGTVDNNGNPTDLDYSGWAFMLGANMKVGEVDLRFGGAYGSGDDRDCDNASSLSACDSDEEFDGFVTSLSDQQKYTFIYEYRTAGADGIKNAGLYNTWYLNLGATMKATPDIKVSADLYYLQASEDTNIGGALDSNGEIQLDSDLGFEIDAKVEYQIDNNLSYYVEAGYLFAGDAYERPEAGQPAGNNEDADDPWAIRHGIILSF